MSTNARLARNVPFADPPWSAPLLPELVLDTIPENATIKGVFTDPMAQELKRRGRGDLVPRDRYLNGKDYPLVEHARMLVMLVADVFGEANLRQGMRKIGRATRSNYVASAAGRTTIGTHTEPELILRATAKAYIRMHSVGEAQLLRYAPGEAVIALREVHTFLDCHHVGAWERVLGALDIHTSVQIASYSPIDADLLLTWDPEAVGS